MFRRLALLAITTAVACSSGRSTDLGTAPGSLAPRLSRFDDRIVLSWVEPDSAGVPTLRFASREKQAWGAPKTAMRDPRLAADGADVPSVVPLGGGGLAANWTVKRGASPHARDLMVAVSKDGGSTWTTPARVHNDDTDSEHGMAALLPTDADGAFGICWLDGRAGELAAYGEGGTSLYWADWKGDHFDPEILLDGRVCDCCKTSAAQGPTGPIVAYRDRSETDRRDIAIVRRDDTRWTAPVRVHADGWSLSACPTNGPSVAARGDRAAFAWFTGANAAPSVWVALSTDAGKTLGTPVRIDGGAPVGRVEATMLPDGSTAVVWLERKSGAAEVRVRRVDPDGGPTRPVVVATTSAARASGYPSITAAGARDVLLAWTETGTPGHVRAALVTLP